MTLAVSYIGGAEDVTNASSYSLVGTSIGTAAADRVVFVAAHWGGVFDTALSSATIGGIAATINIAVSGDGGTNRMVAIFSAAVPTGTTATIALTMSGSTNRMHIEVYAVTGFSSVGDAQSSTPGAAGTADQTLTLTVTDGGGAIAARTINDSTTGTNAWSGVTEDSDGITEIAAFIRSTASASGLSAGSLAVRDIYTPGTAYIGAAFVAVALTATSDVLMAQAIF